MPDLSPADTTPHVQPDDLELFTFLRLVAVALGRGKLTRMQAAAAVLMAVNSDGTTGHGVTVDVDTMAIELDISPRQVWRHTSALIDGGWFTQTHKPTRGMGGKPGRRARYRLTLPRIELAHDIHLPDLKSHANSTSDDDTRNRVTSPRSEMAHEFESNDKKTLTDVTRNRVTEDDSAMAHDFIHRPESCDSSDPNRVTVSRESCDIAEREIGTVLPSVGYPSDGTPRETTERSESNDRARDPEPLLARGA